MTAAFSEYIVRFYIPALIQKLGIDQVPNNRPRLLNVAPGKPITLNDNMMTVIIGSDDDIQVESQSGLYAPKFGEDECQLLHHDQITIKNMGSQTQTISLIQFSI